MHFSFLTAFYFLPFLLIPLLLFFKKKVKFEKLLFPSSIIIEKILKRYHLRRNSILHLFLRILIIFFLILFFAKPYFFLGGVQKLSVYVDNSFSASRYMRRSMRILSSLKEKGLVENVWFYNRKIDSFFENKTSFFEDNLAILPPEKKIVISDFQNGVPKNSIALSSVFNDNDFSITGVTLDKKELLVGETGMFTLYLRGKGETVLNIFLDGKLYKKRYLKIDGAGKEKILLSFSTSKFYKILFSLEDSVYKADNDYYFVLKVHEKRFKYYISDNNFYIETLFSILGGEKSSLENADFVVLFLKDNVVENKILSLEKTKKVFVFPASENIPFYSLPVSYGKKRDKKMVAYFVKNKKDIFNIYKSYEILFKKGKILAQSGKLPTICVYKNLYFFSFLPDIKYSDFVLRPFFYTFFRSIIYPSSLFSLEIGKEYKLGIENNSKVFLNGENVLFGANEKRKNILLTHPGFLEIKKRGGSIWYAVNPPASEYRISSTKIKNRRIGKKIVIDKTMLLLALLLFLIDTIIYFKEQKL